MDPPCRLSLTRRRRMPWTSSPRRGSISRAYSRTTADCSGPVEHQHYTARFMAAAVVDGAWDSGGAGGLQAGAERRPLKLRAMMYRFAGVTCAASCRTVCACSWGGRRRPADAAFATSAVSCRAARAFLWAAAVKAFGADAASCRAARACSLGRRRRMLLGRLQSPGRCRRRLHRVHHQLPRGRLLLLGWRPSGRLAQTPRARGTPQAAMQPAQTPHSQGAPQAAGAASGEVGAGTEVGVIHSRARLPVPALGGSDWHGAARD